MTDNYYLLCKLQKGSGDSGALYPIRNGTGTQELVTLIHHRTPFLIIVKLILKIQYTKWEKQKYDFWLEKS